MKQATSDDDVFFIFAKICKLFLLHFHSNNRKKTSHIRTQQSTKEEVDKQRQYIQPMVRISSVAVILLVGVLTVTTEAFNSLAPTTNRRDVVVKSRSTINNIERSSAASSSLLRSTVQEVGALLYLAIKLSHLFCLASAQNISKSNSSLTFRVLSPFHRPSKGVDRC